jgi:hypothetical protein
MLDGLCIANIWYNWYYVPNHLNFELQYCIIQSEAVESATVMLHLLHPALFLTQMRTPVATDAPQHHCTIVPLPHHGHHTPCLHHSPPLHISCPSRPPLLPSHGTTSVEPLPSTAAWHCISSCQWVSLVLVAAHSPAASMACICSLHFHLILDFITVAYISPKEMASMTIKP